MVEKIVTCPNCGKQFEADVQKTFFTDYRKRPCSPECQVELVNN